MTINSRKPGHRAAALNLAAIVGTYLFAFGTIIAAFLYGALTGQIL